MLREMTHASFKFSIEIGEYTIWELDEHSVWIEHKTGEGMQISKRALGELFHRLYSEAF